MSTVGSAEPHTYFANVSLDDFFAMNPNKEETL
jgi:hypothetical protein